MSTSVNSRVTLVNWPSSGVLSVEVIAPATGASLTPVMVIVTVALLDETVPSDAL